MKSDLSARLLILLLGSLLLSSCSDPNNDVSASSDPGTGETPTDGSEMPADPSITAPLNPDEQLQDPIEDPAQQNLFFNAPYLQVRDAANAAISGFDLAPTLQSALAIVPDGTVGGEDAVADELDAASVSCASGGTVSVTEIVTIEPNTNTRVRSHEFTQCRHNDSTFDGELISTTIQFASGAASRTTVTHEFDLVVDAIGEGLRALDMSGEFATVELNEFNTPANCPQATTLRRQITINEGSTFADPVAGIAARYQSLVYSRSSADRFVQIEPTCEVAVFNTFDAETTGLFASIADASVVISKTGVHSDSGIAESDVPAALTINASASDDALSVTATGDSPVAVQVDILDSNAVQSFMDTWDFAE